MGFINISRSFIFTGASAFAILLLFWHRSAAKHRRKLVYKPWWGPRRGLSSKKPKIDSVETARAILDTVERHILPLTCSGVLAGEPLHGACVLLARTGEVLSAASSQVSSCLLHNAEMLAFEEASLTLKASGRSMSDDCIVVSTHRASLLDTSSIGLPMCKKLGIKEVYVLFDSSTAKIDERGTAYEVAAAAPNEMPEGVLSPNDFKMVGGINVIPLSKLIGEIHMKGREFDDEAEMHRQMAKDKEVLRLQTRLQNLHRIYIRLHREIVGRITTS